MTENTNMDLSTLENWLWEAACVIRGAVDAPKYKDYILPLIFLKRLSDVFEDEIARLAEEIFDSIEEALKQVEEDHALVRFYIPPQARWDAISRQTTNIGEYLTSAVRAVARENPKLHGIFENIDFNAQMAGQPVIDNDRLYNLIQVLSRHRLGLKDVEVDILGRAYEYLLRKFAEGQGQSAGEFYTPREVTWLMAYLLEPRPGDEIYDPACGSGGLLIKSVLALKETYGDDPRIAPVKIYGQEILYTTFAMAKMNAFIHDLEADIRLGDTMARPAFTNPDGSLRTFDKVTANPMWNQKFPLPLYEEDPFDRFKFGGIPPASSADWGWIQHMFASLKEGGKMAVVLDTGSVSRGSGNQGSNRERDIRKVFVENDLVECVILLPENMFYNTTAPGIIMVINKAKKHPAEILLINASKLFTKGRPKNYMEDEHIKQVYSIYREWREEEGLSKIIPVEEAARNDYNLSPSRYVSINGKEEYRPIEEILVELAEVEEERQAVDKELNDILGKLGFGGWLNG
ncbi:type I restriction-modification system subunit M [Neomoorella thermoacetica]|uniref:site-specific DNA-methyltransferase (adenine-specific) n=1 Tax=Moorella thermoacetica (strain ATCC 39073 / JCM 9320) TaxID=264732 RepID=Q2RHW5_MOOTA|nr:class I SAM-dependent DNA methyltransferase [Moorella thermoacetica]AKX94472.1 type I restriction enzyme EcoKI M protein [Moorella thermoacetica]AKX97108.1 type I restriction enzyme EcoKI M protein [Moorella thermoacetica]OIQ55187.1 type I restriction enzyme EcoKI M protein [Moorella thermoacetica]OIQ57473.1 type I restriction enzyme EcoKI M protein [Moorella thermoacetica]QDA00938.1 Type I restriction enzyme EcoKI M protein [Moorella thermoacetica]